LLVVHHLGVDGVSWRVLLEDLGLGYGQLMSGDVLRFPVKTTSFQTWAQHLADRAESPELLKQLPYWEDTLSEIQGELPRGADYGEFGDARLVGAELDSDKTAALLRASHGITALDLIATALADTIAEWTGIPDTVIDLEGHGRDSDDADLDVSRTVGWFTTIYPVRLSSVAGDTPLQAARRTAERLDEPNRLADGPVGYGLLRYGRSDASTDGLRALPAPALRLNYLGRPTDGAACAPFELLTGSTGPAQHPRGRRRYLLDIIAVVLDGRLRFSWSHHPGRHEPGEVQQLADRVLDRLSALVAACRAEAPDADGLSADFAEAGLSDEELDGLLDQLDDVFTEDSGE
ncbi:condensation domain-containing protein, partial [Streptomyces sp. NPDC002078]